MEKRHAMFITAMCVLVIGSGIAATTAGRNSSDHAVDPGFDMSTALHAPGPHVSLGDQAKVFGRFVGTWEVEYMDILKDGKELHRTGQLIVGWVMDGRAIQDLWIVDPSPGRAEREVYADLRYFDPKTLTWPAVFIDPEHASVAKFAGGAIAEDRIVLQTSDLGSKQTRWSFNDIGPKAFVFLDEASSDSGKTWKLQAQYRMRRRSAVTAP
jgi:hypothetical protein